LRTPLQPRKVASRSASIDSTLVEGGDGVATLTIRNLPEETRRGLKLRAARNNRSMEAEARAILQGAAEPETNFVEGWLSAAAQLRGGPLPVPERSLPREVDLG
jgi:antitoxin FitA